MTFELYPMDEQKCYFLIGSDKYLELSGQLFLVDRILGLDRTKFGKAQQVALQGYEVEIKQLPEDMDLSYESFDDMHYQRTGFEIRFQHSFWKYLVNYYIPSGILVIFSWMSEK